MQAQPAPLAYTPPYLAEKILTSRSALEGERKQVTVLFADLKDSTELIRGPRSRSRPAAPRSGPPPHDGRRAPLRGHRQPGARRRHYGPVWRPHCPRRPRRCAPAMPPWPCRRPCAAIPRRSAAPMAWSCGCASASTPAKWWCGRLATTCTWTTRPWGRPRILAARMEQMATPGSIRLTPPPCAWWRAWCRSTPWGRSRSRGSWSRWRCSSWSVPVASGGACRRRRRGA